MTPWDNCVTRMLRPQRLWGAGAPGELRPSIAAGAAAAAEQPRWPSWWTPRELRALPLVRFASAGLSAAARFATLAARRCSRGRRPQGARPTHQCHRSLRLTSCGRPGERAACHASPPQTPRPSRPENSTWSTRSIVERVITLDEGLVILGNGGKAAPHVTLALDVQDTARHDADAAVLRAQCTQRVLRQVHAVAHAVGLHSAGRIHGVTCGAGRAPALLCSETAARAPGQPIPVAPYHKESTWAAWCRRRCPPPDLRRQAR